MSFIFKDYFRQRYLFLGNCPIYLEQFKRIIPTFWYSETEECYLSIVDVVAVLTEQTDLQKARKYWNKLKQRLLEEGNQTVTNCHQLKMKAADGKMRLTDVADQEQLFPNT